MPHTDHDLELRHELLPERQREAVARILPAPRLMLAETLDHLTPTGLQWNKSRFVPPVLRERDGTIPASAELVENLVVHVDEAGVLPVPLGVVRGGRNQFRLRAQIHAHDVQES